MEEETGRVTRQMDEVFATGQPIAISKPGTRQVWRGKSYELAEHIAKNAKESGLDKHLTQKEIFQRALAGWEKPDGSPYNLRSLINSLSRVGK